MINYLIRVIRGIAHAKNRKARSPFLAVSTDTNQNVVHLNAALEMRLKRMALVIRGSEPIEQSH